MPAAVAPWSVVAAWCSASRRHRLRRLPGEPRLPARPDRRPEGRVTPRPGRCTSHRMAEGVAIAFDSLRSNKVRASLTVLGVAIGVTVVIAMGSAITGIDRSITAILESAGPKTFFVQRYFAGGLDVSDGSDELSPGGVCPGSRPTRRSDPAASPHPGHQHRRIHPGPVSSGSITCRVWRSQIQPVLTSRSTAATSSRAGISRRSNMPPAPMSR